MNLRPTTKWIALVLVVAGIAATVMAQGTSEKRPLQTQHPPQTQASPGNGRYQIVFSPHARADNFLLDTQTGKIWTRVEYTNVQGEPEVWKYEERIDGATEFDEWLQRQTIKPKGQATPTLN